MSFRLEQRIGEGGMAIAFLAQRVAPDGQTPVVVKVMRPEVVLNAGATAAIAMQKEAVALGRLNERVPPTAFVVRLIDAGTAELHGPNQPPVPWIGLEYVHGGIEGTTLMERVQYSLANTGYAFDPVRVAHLARCLASGLGAIHGLDIIHRDLTPRNVLCCGFGENEVFKIADFGISRSRGLRATYGQSVPVTPGYAAPEQTLPGPIGIGPHSDLFSLACIIYYVLTGENYFDNRSAVAAMVSIQRGERRSIRASRFLCPELAENAEACRAIDRLLAHASAENPALRPDQAQEFAASIVPWLTGVRSAPRPSLRLLRSVCSQGSRSDASTFRWTVRHPPGDDRVVQSAAWDVDGHCLVTTAAGAAFWTGQTWVDRLPTQTQLPPDIRFAHRLEAGRWLVGGSGGVLAVVQSGSVERVAQCSDQRVAFLHATGHFDDLLVAVGERPGEAPSLWAMAARRWLKPLPLPGVAYVAKLLPLDDSRWVICGRLLEGGGFAAIYTPLHWETTFLLVPRTRALVAGCSEPARALALVVGSQGVALRIDGEHVQSSVADGAPDLTASAMDVLDREWVASLGSLWMRNTDKENSWRRVWHDPAWRAPFVSLMADEGMVVAMTADGGIVEGRAA